MLINKTPRGRKSGNTINGNTEDYQVATGENISIGDFVEFIIENSTVKVKNYNSIINGIAKTGGGQGTVISVFVPEEAG